jgi:hypothetical protein
MRQGQAKPKDFDNSWLGVMNATVTGTLTYKGKSVLVAVHPNGVTTGANELAVPTGAIVRVTSRLLGRERYRIIDAPGDTRCNYRWAERIR